MLYFFFFFNDTATTEIYTLSLHDALPISVDGSLRIALDTGLIRGSISGRAPDLARWSRSEEHTSELQSRQYLVCRLLLEKKKKKQQLLQTRAHVPIVSSIATLLRPSPCRL